MEKQPYRQTLKPRAKHVGAIVAQVGEWQGTNWTNYNESMDLDAILVEVDNVWFFRPGNQRARVEFQDVKFKGFNGLEIGPPEEYDTEHIVVVSKKVDNRKGETPIVSKMEWEETNTETREKGFKQAIGFAAETAFEAGTEYAKFSAKISASSETEWSNSSGSSHAETVRISEEVSTPPGAHEWIKVVLSRTSVRERITGNVDLEHKVVVASARPDNSYYYVLVWDSFADFLQCVERTAPSSWTGARELGKANIRQLNLDCIRQPTAALVDVFNEYKNALSLEVVRTPL